MAELNWTHEAESWLKDIYEYIALDNPKAAAGVVDGIYEQAQTLIANPHIGYKYVGTEEEVRILLYGHYRIAYFIKPDNNIDIVGVFHGALDIDKYLL